MVYDYDEQYEHGRISGPVVVDFYATWCPPCKAMSPILEELSNEMNEVTFLKVDVDTHEDLVRQYEIRSMPTFVVLYDQVEIDRMIGATSKDKFQEWIRDCIDIEEITPSPDF